MQCRFVFVLVWLEHVGFCVHRFSEDWLLGGCSVDLMLMVAWRSLPLLLCSYLGFWASTVRNIMYAGLEASLAEVWGWHYCLWSHRLVQRKWPQHGCLEMASAAQAHWVWFRTLAGRVAASIPSTCAVPYMLFVPPRARAYNASFREHDSKCAPAIAALDSFITWFRAQYDVTLHSSYSDFTHWYDVDIAELSIHDWVGATWPNDWWHLATFGRSSSKWHWSHDIDSESPFGSACSMHATSSGRILMMICWMALGLPRFFFVGVWHRPCPTHVLHWQFVPEQEHGISSAMMRGVFASSQLLSPDPKKAHCRPWI